MDNQKFRNLLSDGIHEMSLTELSNDTLLQLSAFHGILTKWNKKINLTAHRRLQDSVEKNFLDSLSLLPLLLDKRDVFDIGSGAGFPGIVIAVSMPHMKITLSESDRRKSAFLSAVVRELSLQNVEVLTEHVDQKSIERLELQTHFDAIVSRATISILELLPIGKICLKSGGKLFGMISLKFSAQDIQLMCDLHSFKFETFHSYQLPFSKIDRKILIFIKE
jgi:16S rRNA (guanine527-N7)-methyltransferase